MEENILNALNEIVNFIKRGETFELFDPEFEKTECLSQASRLLREKLGLNIYQAALLGLAIEESAGKRTSYQEIARAAWCSYLDLMSHAKDFQTLRKLGYLRITEDIISIPNEALEALMNNRPYEKAAATGLSTHAIMMKMRKYVGKLKRDELAEDLFLEEIDMLFRNNPETSVAMGYNKHIAPLKLNPAEKYLFYIAFYGTRFLGDQFAACDLRDYYIDDSHFEDTLYNFEMAPETIALVKNHIIEPVTKDGMVDEGVFQIRKDIVSDMLQEEIAKQSNEKTIWLEDSSKFIQKELFYNESEGQQIARLSSLISEDNLHRVFESMEAKGMRTGFTCLFYGAPGTGKTETALQLARTTGRKVLSADVAKIMSKWVGESEHNARRLFRDYKAANDDNELTPILLLNEADAFLGKRFENVRTATEKMENGLQNIFLEELERFSGILIATTNLTTNLDPAFERRFLFKVCFDKPSEEVRANIWKSNIPELSEDEARKLAATYDFSGGQIENIVRKKDIEAILNNLEPDFATICRFCDEEKITDRRRAIGFKTN